MIGNRSTHHKRRQKLRAKLRSQGVPEDEIERRVAKIQRHQQKVRADVRRWEAERDARITPDADTDDTGRTA